MTPESRTHLICDGGWLGWSTLKPVQAIEMSEEKKKPPFPFLKLLALIFVVLVGGTLLFSKFLGSSILYRFDQVETSAIRVVTDDPESEEHIYLSLQYDGCDQVYEHIDLGRKELKGKVPEQLQKMRACLDEFSIGENASITVERRTQRITGSRAGRVTKVGECILIEPFPSTFEFKGSARCPWM